MCVQPMLTSVRPVIFLSSCILRQGLLLNLELFDGAGLLSKLLWGLFCLCFKSTGLQAACTHTWLPQFLCFSLDLDSLDPCLTKLKSPKVKINNRDVGWLECKLREHLIQEENQIIQLYKKTIKGNHHRTTVTLNIVMLLSNIKWIILKIWFKPIVL